MGFFSLLLKSMFGSKDGKKNRIIDDLQIEITHICPFNKNTNKYMDWSTFMEVANYFELAKRVHFTGWGDPFLHSQALEMIRTAKEKGVQVEITTNGTELSHHVIDELVNLKIDQLTISLFYPHHSLDSIHDNIKNLLEIRNKLPKVILDFTMTRNNINQLPEFIELVGDLGVDEVKASNINFILSAEHNNLKIFEGIVSEDSRGDLIKQGKAKGKEEFETLISEAEKIANRKGIYFSSKPLVPNEAVMCEYSPLKNVFITWEGLMTPCQCLGLQNSKNYFNEKEYDLEPFIIGNITSTNFLDLWHDNKYQYFRDIYKRRVKIFNNYMEETFEEEPNAKLIFNNYQKLEQELAEEKLPEVCARCYKAYSI